MTPETPLVARLSAPLRTRLMRLADDAVNPVGARRPIQSIIDRHLDLFEDLLAADVGYDAISRLLGEIGVVDRTGRPLPIGSLSSAVSRGRDRRPAAEARRPGAHQRTRQEPAATGRGMQVPASACSDLQAPLAANSDHSRSGVDAFVPTSAGAHEHPDSSIDERKRTPSPGGESRDVPRDGSQVAPRPVFKAGDLLNRIADRDAGQKRS